jgi:hypothetical protein
VKKEGFDKVRRFLNRLPEKVEDEFDRANRENAADLVAMARVLIPNKTGVNRALINHGAVPDGGQLIDFGPRAKVIEGRNGPRPFVNPALRLTKKLRAARVRKAIRDAVRGAKDA